MAVYDNKAADELARAKCWHRAWREVRRRPKGKRRGCLVVGQQIIVPKVPSNIALMNSPLSLLLTSWFHTG